MNTRELVYAGRFLQMVKSGRWEFVTRAGGVSAVGIIAVTDAGEILLVEQPRIPLGVNTIELPAGLVGDESADEEIELAARRELLEETGYAAREVEYLFDGPSSAGLTDEQVHLVMARGLERRSDGGGVAGEQITVHRVPLAEAERFLADRRAQGIQVDLKVRLALYYLTAKG